MIPVYKILEYTDNNSKTSESLYYYCRDEPELDNNGVIVDFTNDNTNDSFNCKEKIIGQTGKDCRKSVQIMMQLKHLSNFWGTLEMPLINCEINAMLIWSANTLISSNADANQTASFEITDANLHVPVVAFSTQDNTKLL